MTDESKQEGVEYPSQPAVPGLDARPVDGEPDPAPDVSDEEQTAAPDPEQQAVLDEGFAERAEQEDVPVEALNAEQTSEVRDDSESK